MPKTPQLELEPGDARALVFCIRREVVRLRLAKNAPATPRSHADDTDAEHIKRINRIYASLAFI